MQGGGEMMILFNICFSHQPGIKVIKSLGHIFVHVCVKLDQFLQILGVNMTEVFATNNMFSNLLKQHPPKNLL